MLTATHRMMRQDPQNIGPIQHWIASCINCRYMQIVLIKINCAVHHHHHHYHRKKGSICLLNSTYKHERFLLKQVAEIVFPNKTRKKRRKFHRKNRCFANYCCPQLMVYHKTQASCSKLNLFKLLYDPWFNERQLIHYHKR